MGKILICTVVCQLASNKVLQHCFPHFYKKLKGCHGNINYYKLDSKNIKLIVLIVFVLVKIPS